MCNLLHLHAMQIKRIQFSATKINLSLFLLSLFFSLAVKLEPAVWPYYGDPVDYLRQSKASWLSSDLYFPERAEGFYPRPFTVPLIYKLSNGEADAIINLQRFIHFFSVWIFAAVFLAFIRNYLIQIIFLFSWYFLMSWWPLLGWAHNLLSESLSLSLLLIWIASFIHFHRQKSYISLFLHAIALVLLSFTRDNWPYYFLMFYTMMIAGQWFIEKSFIKKYLPILGLCLALFFIQQQTADLGMRHQLPVMNNIVYRILPNPEYTQWFVDRGMPQADLIKECFNETNNLKMIYPLYTDERFKEFHHWAATEGRGKYTMFMLSHPSYLLLRNEDASSLQQMFQHEFYFISSAIGYSIYADYVFPFFGRNKLIVLLIISLMLFIKTRNFAFHLINVLLISTLIMSVLIYLADALEIDRHCYMTQIMMQIAGILLCIVILDYFITYHWQNIKIRLIKSSLFLRKQ